jgi:hypothetical protein
MTIHTNIKNQTDHQLLQSLDDAEKEVNRLKAELQRRLENRHPRLFRKMQSATREALNRPSMMERSRIR